MSLVIAASLGCTPTGRPEPPSAPRWDALALAVSPGPYLTADEFVLGGSAEIAINNAAPNAMVQFAISTTGEGGGPAYYGIPTALESPIVVGTTVTDANGYARMPYAVPVDAGPGSAFVQAAWWDAAAGTGGTSDVELRNYTLPNADSPIGLADETAAAGFANVYVGGNTHTGGVAWVDYNRDYWPDLFVTNGGGRDHTLWRNDGDGTFTDVSFLVPKPDVAKEDAGIACVDIDNDHDTDCLVTGDNATHMDPGGINPYDGGPNLLYVNNGDGTFTESAAAYGLVDPRGWRTINGMFSDYDRDGFLDVYLGNWAMDPTAGVQDNYDRLMHNEGGVWFADETARAGTDGHGRDNLAMLWFDADMDGWPDLYVGNASAENAPPTYDPADVLYRNEGDGRFTDATLSSPGWGDDAWAAMGADVGDVDGDGDWDLHIADLFHYNRWVGDVAPRGDVLYLGNGDGTFADNSCDTANLCGGFLAWGTNFADFDRDGKIDLWEGTSSELQPELMFHNLGDGTFQAVEAGYVEVRATGGAIADYDGDGAMDLFVVPDGGNVRLYRNEARDTNHWLEIKLMGVVSNIDAVDATVRATTTSGTQLRRVTGGDSAHSHSELILHFGLGADTTADVEVTWPSGIVQQLGTIDADQLVFVNERRGVVAERLDHTATSATWSAAGQVVEVAARSTFGGRTGLSVTDGGDLTWNPETALWEGTFPSVVAPMRVEIVSDRGKRWHVPVVAVP